MSSQRERLRMFFAERVRGVTAITLLTLAIVTVGYLFSVILVWVLT